MHKHPHAYVHAWREFLQEALVCDRAFVGSSSCFLLKEEHQQKKCLIHLADNYLFGNRLCRDYFAPISLLLAFQILLLSFDPCGEGEMRAMQTKKSKNTSKALHCAYHSIMSSFQGRSEGQAHTCSDNWFIGQRNRLNCLAQMAEMQHWTSGAWTLIEEYPQSTGTLAPGTSRLGSFMTFMVTSVTLFPSPFRRLL